MTKKNSHKNNARLRRAEIARETLEILKRGSYIPPQGKKVDLKKSIDFAVSNSFLVRPGRKEEFYRQVEEMRKGDFSFQTKIEVTAETTLEAARRLTEEGRFTNIGCLNFASAKNPGGGLLKGSGAQEESLARASALYACLSSFKELYEVNRKYKSALYTDHMIYSPQVPVFRDMEDNLLRHPFCINIITAPAVNAGVVESREPHNAHRIDEVMVERIGMILALAAVQRSDALVLGAYGCGVFKNGPHRVAEYFAHYLTRDGYFAGIFSHITFAVPPGKGTPSNYESFKQHFSNIS